MLKPSTRSLTLAAGLPLALALTSCAALGAMSPSQREAQRQIDAGSALARSQCLSCHQRDGVVLEGAPPPFTEVARRYRDARLDWELETIAEVGHYRMPRKALSAAEITALTAYIRSLDTGPRDDVVGPRATGANAATHLD